MAEHAATLVDDLLPRVPVRQWVLTLPYRLRYRLAWDHTLCRAVLGVYARTLLAFYARTARGLGIPDGQTGIVTVIQRFGSGLQLNVHFHTLVLDGVFSQPRPGPLISHPAPPPSDNDVAHVLAIVRARVGRLLARHQLEPADDRTPADPLTETSPVLAGLVSASVQGRVALGPRARARVRRLGDEPDLRHLTSRGPRQATSTASTCTPTSGSPPTIAPASSNSAAISSASRSLRIASASAPTGASSSNSQTVWRDGTSHFLFEPIEFLEKLAALIPRPAVNLLLYHGVLASRARWRSQVVRYGRPAPDAAALTREAHPAVPTHAWTWAALMHRTLDLAVLAWPRCGGRLRIVATIQDPAPRARLPRPPQLGAGPRHPRPRPQPDHTAATP